MAEARNSNSSRKGRTSAKFITRTVVPAMPGRPLALQPQPARRVDGCARFRELAPESTLVRASAATPERRFVGGSVVECPVALV